VLTAGALACPDRTALTYCGERRFSYAELDRAVNRRAHALLRAGVAPGRRVAALLGETLGVAETYLAQFKIGAVTAALNPFWSADGQPEIRGPVEDALALFFPCGSADLPRAGLHSHASALATAGLWHDIPREADSVFGTGAIIWGIGFPAIAGPALYGRMHLVL